MVFLSVVLISGCIQQSDLPEDPIVAKCVMLCKAQSMDLSDGPCLTDGGVDFYDDWVCDVAHSPRQDVDNLPENQCQEFRNGEAHHFVEVDLSCEFIRKL
jgi:hypothetical protein